MAAPNQNYLINYGGTLIGGTGAGAARIIRGYCTYNNSFTESTFSCLITTGASTKSAADSEFTAIEDAFRKPRQDFVFTDNGVTVLSLKQSDSTGLDCNPEAHKEGHPSDTGLSRTYRIRLTFGRPSDNLSNAGRRSSTVNVTQDPSAIPTVIVNGVYTALGANDSYTQYLNNVAAFVNGELSFISSGTTFELIGVPQAEYNSTRKVMSFSRVYRAVIHNQSSGSLDDPAIVNPVMTISRERYGPGDSVDLPGGWTTAPNDGPFSIRPTILNVTYTAGIDQTVSTDLTGAQWANKLRPFILSEVNSVLGGGTVALLEEKPEFDAYQNRINIGLRVLAVVSGQILEQTIVVKDRMQPNWVLIPLWKASRFARYKHPGPSTRIRTIVEDRVVVGTVDANTYGTGADFSFGPWVQLSREPATKNRRIGILGNTIDVTDVHVETIYEYAEIEEAPSTPGRPDTPTDKPGVPVATGLSSGSMSQVH